ncbi:MAG TPA: Minf_1886 family protein [Planctomycetota bacterium]|nr:Minf_1886 family protein [Planctomycetota bacterium]
MPSNLEERLKSVVARDGRYHLNAYRFVYEALDYSVKQLEKKRHISGRELLEGIKNLAIEQFGGLAVMVFDVWGVRKTSDFGNIVFNLVGADLMSRSEEDTREDFDGVYDFREVFRIDAKPRSTKSPK